MTDISTQTLAEETLQLRLTMHSLMATGLSESQALLQILPDDNDRRKKLNLWKALGIWPPPEAGEEANLDQTVTPLPQVADLSGRDIPEEWLQRITGVISTTVNAAILDYHNVQSDQIERQIETTIQDKLQGHLAHLKAFQPDHIVEMVRETVREIMADRTYASPDPGEPLVTPPRPRTVKGTRKLVVPRRKLQGTCDSTLFELFESERESRGFNVSQMLDFILYNHYGQPRLSFESDDPTSEPDDYD